METIIKPGYEKILILFYKEKNAKIHLREIARRSKLNENSVSRFLKELEKEKIVLAKKDGNLKKYETLNNEKVYALWTQFDISRLNRLPSIRKNAIRYFMDALKEKPVIILLFGSSAKETFTERSDIDLLLVVNKKISTREAEHYADAQTALKISCIQIEMHEMKDELKLKNDQVIQSAIKTGYPLTNHIEYYRMVNHERV